MPSSLVSIIVHPHSLIILQCFNASFTDMLGPRGTAFDSDDLPDEFDDEDLKGDPISQMDMTVRCCRHSHPLHALRAC